jgi:predicted nuclease of predicted toxin-antitoxin system
VALRLYFDHNVRRPVSEGLRLRAVDLLTAWEDESHRLQDPELLDRATSLGRVLFSQDEDLLAEAAQRQRTGRDFAGVIYAHQMSLSVRDCIDQLELVAKACEPEELRGRVLFLPIR